MIGGVFLFVLIDTESYFSYRFIARNSEEEMVVEYAVLSSPLYRHLVNEDAFAESSRHFFIAMVDGYGVAVGSDGKRVPKDVRVRAFSEALALMLVEEFGKNPDTSKFPELFDCAAERIDARFKHLIGEVDEDGCELQTLGAVVSCIAVADGVIHLAQAGDCRLYASNDPGRGYRLLTTDHNGRDPRELARFAALDLGHRLRFSLDRLRQPRLCWRKLDGYWTGGLAVTRGFGSWQNYQPMMTHVPEVLQFSLSEFEPGTIFALCTDGGSKIVQSLFIDMGSVGADVPMSCVMCALQAQLEKRGQNDDVTILLFRVVPE